MNSLGDNPQNPLNLVNSKRDFCQCVKILSFGAALPPVLDFMSYRYMNSKVGINSYTFHFGLKKKMNINNSFPFYVILEK